MLSAYMFERWINICKQCGKLLETGHRCPGECEAKHREREQARWDEKVKERERSGLCPRCEERPVLPGAKSCLECGLGVKDQDYVSAAYRGSVWDPLKRRWQGLRRLTKKWLGDD
jgi:hypothetical protein